MGMVTYDGLNGASAQSCKTDRLTVFVQAKYCGSDRRWCMNIHMRSSSGLFRIHINAKSANQFPACKRILKRNVVKIIAPLPLTTPNEGCITVYFFLGIKYFVWKMQILLSILFCLQQKKVYKKPKKKQKIDWITDARNRTWAVRVRVRYRSRYTIAAILKYLLIIISN